MSTLQDKVLRDWWEKHNPEFLRVYDRYFERGVKAEKEGTHTSWLDFTWPKRLKTDWRVEDG